MIAALRDLLRRERPRPARVLVDAASAADLERLVRLLADSSAERLADRLARLYAAFPPDEGVMRRLSTLQQGTPARAARPTTAYASATPSRPTASRAARRRTTRPSRSGSRGRRRRRGSPLRESLPDGDAVAIVFFFRLVVGQGQADGTRTECDTGVLKTYHAWA